MNKYDAKAAQAYDAASPMDDAAAAAVDFLAALCDKGTALEFGVGTGRLAIPLAETGTTVTGIDVSEDMLARLREKPGGERVTALTGDMCPVRLGRTFDLVYLPISTISSLHTQQLQAECFATAAAHLSHGGHFVIEALVPPRDLPVGGLPVRTESVGADGLVLVAGWHDPVAQTYQRRTVKIGDGRMSVSSHTTRYAYPAELDLMARLAGLHLQARYADWRKAPFTADSGLHVSVYRAGPAG
jgi:SAM-dependent methyltransferase